MLDFAEEALGTYEGGFLSRECACVQLSDDLGEFGVLQVIGLSSGTRALLVGEEGGDLVLEFLVPITAISIDFGNDSDSEFVSPTVATLRGFSGGVEVAAAELLANRNRLVDQTLTIAPGVPMDRAIFRFPQLGEFEPISPIVDNIVLTVPEPAALSFGALALAAIGAVRASRSQPR